METSLSLHQNHNRRRQGRRRIDDRDAGVRRRRDLRGRAAVRRRAGEDLEPPGPPRRQHPKRRLLRDRKSTRLNSSHTVISYAVFCLKKKKKKTKDKTRLQNIERK